MTSHDDERPDARFAHADITVPASPEDVWRAIATGEGTATWAFPAEIEAREGGTVIVHRGPYAPDGVATVTAWEPPHRFAYEETLPGVPAPLATEFLVETDERGTCVVRVVSGLHEHGEGWEDMIEGTVDGWRLALLLLRGYLTHFAGQPAASLEATVNVGARPDDSANLVDRLGLTGLTVGDPYRTPQDAPPLAGVVEHALPDMVLVRTTEPCPALVFLGNRSMDLETTSLIVSGRLYGPEAAAVAEREQQRWNAWLTERFTSST